MNILIPDSWLREYLDTKANVAQIQKYLSLCGPSVERVEKVGNDYVYDIEITTNRVDSMSVMGIAREAASILPEFGIKARFKDLKFKNISNRKNLDIKIINDPKLCKRILAIKLSGVAINSSPAWLKNKLKKVGQRSLNNIIDVTNYVMWEVGHPIHAFDYDRLEEKTVVVREAKKGESLKTLDGKKYILAGGEVVFGNGKGRIIDLPGIMGTKNTVVTNDTKNVLLWIESIDATKIRKTSMNLSIRTQAAVLNEKHVDPNLGVSAILKAVEIYKKIAKAKVESKLYDENLEKESKQTVRLTQKRLDTYMGLSISSKRVKRILENLGCRVVVGKVKNKKSNGKNIKNKNDLVYYDVTPPTFRKRDIKIAEDVIEEVARIYGYHNLPSKIMDTKIPINPVSENFGLEYRIKTWLSGWGLNEIYTYSMVSDNLAIKSGYKINEHLKIANPLSDDWVYMRRSIIPSLIQVVEDNQKNNVSVFEMQNVYHMNDKKNKLPNEELQLVILTNKSFEYLKGILDALASKLFIRNIRVEPKTNKTKIFSTKAVGDILADSIKIGEIGKIKNQNLFSLSLSMSLVQKVARLHPRYLPIINKPPIVEDLTFVLSKNVYLGHVIEEIKLTSSLVELVSLKSKYNKGINNKKQNITFTIIYRDAKESLTDEKIMPIRKKIVENLKKSFKAVLVGEI